MKLGLVALEQFIDLKDKIITLGCVFFGHIAGLVLHYLSFIPSLLSCFVFSIF